MDTSDQKNNLIPPPYSTPFNVDFFLHKSKGEFADCVKRVLSLPKLIQNISTDPSTAEFIEEGLGQTYELNAEQKAELTRIIRDILLADVFLGDFPMIISQKLNIDTGTASQIAQKIVNELFAPAVEDIKKMQRERFADRIAQTRTSQPQQTPQNTDTEQGNVINLRNRENQ